MSNVVAVDFSPAARQLRAGDRLAALAQSFSGERRFGDDVFWLKENAEFLSVLAASGVDACGALDAYGGFYRAVPRRMTFFPQYYRFLISITLDLEDLGLEGETGAALIEFARAHNLADAELSDLQRAEARRLFARRGIDLPDAGLDERLLAFAGRPSTFAVPNKKASYELSHVIFYLTEYGRRDVDFDPAVRESLLNVGILAWLEQNADLLAEVCIALRYAGWEAPEEWEAWLLTHLEGFAVESQSSWDRNDDYHEYLVLNWFAAGLGMPVFAACEGATGRITLHRPMNTGGALREVSECLLQAESARSGDWEAMRPRLARQASPVAIELLERASRATDQFPAFFETFARAAQVAV